MLSGGFDNLPRPPIEAKRSLILTRSLASSLSLSISRLRTFDSTLVTLLILLASLFGPRPPLAFFAPSSSLLPSVSLSSSDEPYADCFVFFSRTDAGLETTSTISSFPFHVCSSLVIVLLFIIAEALELALDRDRLAAAAAIVATEAVTLAKEKVEACLGRMPGRSVGAGTDSPVASSGALALGAEMRPRRALQDESTTPVMTLLAESAADPAISPT